MAVSKILQAQSALNAQKGTFYFTPRFGKYAGIQIELFDLVSFNLDLDTSDTTRNVLNGTAAQHIDEETNLSWTIQCYYVRSEFVEMAFEKKKKKIPIIGDVTVTNNMSNTDMGTQTVKLTGFEIKSVKGLLKLDVNDHDAKIDLSGYVDDGDIINTFNTPDVEWSDTTP